MNDYYSDPETLADIDKQLMKDRLYMMNNPEMAMKIDEAEREADKRVAQKAIDLGDATIVTKKSYDEPDVFESAQYKKTAETKHYVIYQRSE